MEINEENREECRICFIRGLYQDLHKKYEDALVKNAELLKLMSELCAENERLHEKQQKNGLLLFSQRILQLKSRISC